MLRHKIIALLLGWAILSYDYPKCPQKVNAPFPGSTNTCLIDIIFPKNKQRIIENAYKFPGLTATLDDVNLKLNSKETIGFNTNLGMYLTVDEQINYFKKGYSPSERNIACKLTEAISRILK